MNIGNLQILQPEGFPGLPEGWVTGWETFPSADQKVQLFQACHYSESPAKPPGARRALLIVHGLGEHGGRYLHAAHYLKDAVDAIYCLDLRGHGRSEGLRGHCDQMSQFTDDLAMAIRRLTVPPAEKASAPLELHVLGHSFGGLVVLRTFFLNSALAVRSVAVSSPLLGIRVKIPALKRLVGKALSELWGSLHMSNEIDITKLSHDPAVVVAYKKDRLVHDKITPRMFSEMLGAIDDTLKRDTGFQYPLQMQLSLQDEIVDAEASQAFFGNLGNPGNLKTQEKRLKTYPGFYHELFNEVKKEKPFEDLATWIKATKPGSSA